MGDDDLILGNPGTSTLSTREETGGWTPANLTDGDAQGPKCCGNGRGVYGGIASGTITYDLGGPCTITGIESWTSWDGGGRDNQNYTVSYSLDGNEFIPLWTVAYNPNTSRGNRVSLAINDLVDVVSIRFDFSAPQQNGWVTYSELAVYGQSSTSSTPTLSGAKKDANGFSFSFSGPSGQPYTLLSTTNVALPLSQWQTNSTGVLTGVDNPIGFTNSTPTEPQQFYRVRSP